MQSEYKSIHRLLPCIFNHVNPIELIEDTSTCDSEERDKFEKFVFTKLEEYSKKRTVNLFHLTSLSHIRRRLKRDLKSYARQTNSNIVSIEKLSQWTDEIFDKIEVHLSKFQNNLEQFLTTDDILSSSSTINNQWKQIQLQKAKTIFSNSTYDNDKELLLMYQNSIIEKLTPKQLDKNQILLINKDKIHLDEEYEKAENIGREYLTNLFHKYKHRQLPDLQLLKEMINLGMKQMIKRPKLNEFHQASNLLTKAIFILKSKQSYLMSLRNLADDFMLLRFGRSLDTEKSINNRFISLIHAFLNTISCLIYLLKTDSSESFSSTSFFSPFNCHLSIEDILSPLKYIDEWTWLLEKWRIALETFPIELTNQGAFGRLVRTTIGVGIARLYGFAINDEHDELDEKFFQALQMGFYYGIAYALVDGLQDNQEQIDIDTWLKKMEDILCGSEQLNLSLLPELPITPLLLETFHSLIQLTSENFITVETFTDLALLLRSQRIDKKDLNRSDYTDIDIFIGPLLKAHFTYTATVYMSGAKILTNDQRLWLMPFLGQLTDDCRDFHEDRQTKSVTPVTYYAQHNGVTLNPFFVFLFICENLYLESDRENNTGAFLGRRIMRTLRAIGSDLKEFLQIFTSTSYPDLCKYCLSLEYFFNHISDPEKTIFRHINTFAKNYSYNHRTLETFAYDYLPIIEKELFIDTNNDNNPLIHGMNHSLKAGGKRLRPLILLMVAQLYNIDIKRILPLARAIEYLHTSSLIFDDLPAQDNAPLRRGKPTLHMTIDSDYNNIPSSLTEGRAQLAAIDLIGYAIQLVTIDLHNENFSYESINRVTAELAQSMKELCYGQFLDLQSARNEKLLTINELDRIAYLKTGKAIEVTLICPVLLIEQKQSLDELRQLGRLMGILFQMKDDLLDIEGHTDQLGKLQNIDQQNQTITYINLLGIEGTRQRIREIRKQAELILDNLWPQSNTIRDVIRYICERKK
ncbi:unnamed protein product [Adineta steineri]|uniref:Uncharacterized protein n=1 Tax=Adineta steineri TaxID=433720 RepID=A0A818Z5I4_9BILA|nr:unnamed protein product [Adineta steineri]